MRKIYNLGIIAMATALMATQRAVHPEHLGPRLKPSYEPDPAPQPATAVSIEPTPEPYPLGTLGLDDWQHRRRGLRPRPGAPLDQAPGRPPVARVSLFDGHVRTPQEIETIRRAEEKRLRKQQARP